MKKANKRLVGVLAVVLVALIAMGMVIGVDTNWGKTEVTRITLLSAEGDEISAMLYKPDSATPENPAPCVMICHGGNDMLEQAGAYALELSRRGYVCITWDYTGCHWSDIATGSSETANDPISGLQTMGSETVWKTVQSFNFVDFSKVVAMGHSMGGVYTMGFSLKHQDEVFLQVNLGMNNYGADTNQNHNFNFVNILGDADESALSRSENNVMNLFGNEQLKRIFSGDYAGDAAALPTIEIGKVYTATGTNGKEYTRTGYMPASCHAYYLTNNDAVRTVVYAITSQVGMGLDDGVGSYADREKIGMAWQIKDAGFLLIFACIVALAFLTASLLLDSAAFASLKLQQLPSPGFKAKSKLWWVALAVLALIPVGLYRVGILSSTKFLGIDISQIWLLSGTNNAYISWQWVTSIAMLVFFVLFHFFYGRKNGGNIRTYGFATSDDGTFQIGYIVKALAFGAITIGLSYVLFATLSAYTQQGIHILTFMLSTIKPNRTLCFLVYFLFQIPYFLTSSLAVKSLSVTNTTDDKKGLLKSVGITTLVSVGGLIVLWVVFALILNVGNTLTTMDYFMKDRMYIYAIAILPLVIGMAVANALNIFISKKTNSAWAGFFTALLWGTWMIISCGGMAKYIY